MLKALSSNSARKFHAVRYQTFYGPALAADKGSLSILLFLLFLSQKKQLVRKKVFNPGSKREEVAYVARRSLLLLPPFPFSFVSFSCSLALSLSFLSIDGGSFVSKRQLHRGTSVWAVQRKQETHMWR